MPTSFFVSPLSLFCLFSAAPAPAWTGGQDMGRRGDSGAGRRRDRMGWDLPTVAACLYMHCLFPTCPHPSLTMHFPLPCYLRLPSLPLLCLYILTSLLPSSVLLPQVTFHLPFLSAFLLSLVTFHDIPHLQLSEEENETDARRQTTPGRQTVETGLGWTGTGWFSPFVHGFRHRQCMGSCIDSVPKNIW